MNKPIIATLALLALFTAPAPGAAGSVPNHVQVYVTARDTGQKLANAGDVAMAAGSPVGEKDEFIFVDPAKTFQTFLGIGGALTDASAETFYKLPAASQQE